METCEWIVRGLKGKGSIISPTMLSLYLLLDRGGGSWWRSQHHPLHNSEANGCTNLSLYYSHNSKHFRANLTVNLPIGWNLSVHWKSYVSHLADRTACWILSATCLVVWSSINLTHKPSLIISEMDNSSRGESNLNTCQDVLDMTWTCIKMSCLVFMLIPFVLWVEIRWHPVYGKLVWTLVHWLEF